MAVSFIGGGNRSSRRKPPTYNNSFTKQQQQQQQITSKKQKQKQQKQFRTSHWPGSKLYMKYRNNINFVLISHRWKLDSFHI